MSQDPRSRPVAPLVRELRCIGGGLLAVGAGGLAASLVLIDGPLRALLLFAVSGTAVGVTAALRGGWIDEETAPTVPPGTAVEGRRDTVQRTLVVLLPACVLVAACLPLAVGLAALISGVVAGTGVGDLAGARRARRRQLGTGATLYRELGGHPFAGPRRPLYTRPRSASTLST